MKESFTLKFLQNWEIKTQQKTTSVPSKTDVPHFLISEGNDGEFDDPKKIRCLVSVVDVLHVEKIFPDVD